MPINFAIYITNPNNYNACVSLVNSLAVYNIKCALLGTPPCSKYPNVQVVPDIVQVLQGLALNNLNILICDKTIDYFYNNIYLTLLWSETMELYAGSKRYKISNQLDSFIVDIIKTRSFVPYGYIYNEQTYLYIYDTDNMNPMINKISNTILGGDTKINLLWNFGDAITLKNKWRHLTENLDISLSESPYCVVINNTQIQIDHNKLIYFCMEPKGEQQYKNYLDRFVHTKPLFIGTHKNHLNNIEWHLKPSLKQLKTKQIQKKHNKVLSVIVSDKNWDPGHKFRLELITLLDNMTDKERGYELHIYGRCKNLNFNNWKGELPDQEKDKALFDYKYQLNVENHYINNYITEKLADGFIAECLTFYKGAPNVSTFFNSNSYVELSDDQNSNIELIRKCIETDKYSQSLLSIQKSKWDILHKYSFEPRVQSIMYLSKCKAYVTSNIIKEHLVDNDFRNCNVVPIDNFNNIISILQQSSFEHPIYIQMSDNCHPLIYDRLCFAIAEAKQKTTTNSIEVIIIYKTDSIIDALFYPSACEKILNNAKAKQNIFANVHVANIQ